MVVPLQGGSLGGGAAAVCAWVLVPLQGVAAVCACFSYRDVSCRYSISCNPCDVFRSVVNRE